MHLFTIISCFLFGESTSLTRRRSNTDTFIEEYERDTINEVANSISDAQQNLANYNFYGGFYAQADDEFNKTNARKNLNGNQEIRRILNEIEAEEINITKSTDDVEQVVRGFLSDLEYFNNKINKNVVDKIGDHVVIANSTEGDEYENKTSNLDNNTISYYSREDDGYDSQPNDHNDEIKEYNGTSPSSGRRIYRGRKTRISQFPFMASIHVMGQFYCAGSIIASSLVITAASCLQLAWNNRFFRENPKFLYVRVGSTYYNGGGELIQVLEVYFHPSYDPKSLRNNLAILRLKRKIRFSKHHRKGVKKIRYDTHAKPLSLITDDILILGWGAKEIGNKIINPMNNKLSYGPLDIYGLEECQELYSKAFVTKKHFCAGFISKGGGACNHDVGAPGLVGGILTGVASFGAPVCGAHDAPTVFTKLGYYKDWIENIKEQPFRSMKKHEEIFLPYRMAELIATPTTRMLTMTPYIDPKVKEALKGISFLRPTTKPNYDRDSAVNNMLLMSMGRPAIADQPYYQVKNDLSENQTHSIENKKQFSQGLRQTKIITTTGTKGQLDKHNEYFKQNSIPYTTDKIRNKPLKPNDENYKETSKTIQKQKNKPKDSFIDMSRQNKKEKKKIKNNKMDLRKEKDEQIEENNLEYIVNSYKNLLKQSHSELELDNDLNTNKTVLKKISDANKPSNQKHSTKKRKPTSDFNPEPVIEPQFSLYLQSESVEKIKHPKHLNTGTVNEIHLPTDLDIENVKKQRYPSHVDPERIQATEFPTDSESESVKKIKDPKRLDSDFESESLKVIQQPYIHEKSIQDRQHLNDSDAELVKETQFMIDLEQNNDNKKHPSSEYDPTHHKKNKTRYSDNSTSRDKSKLHNKKEKTSSDLDPDHVALDKVADGLRPSQDKDDIKKIYMNYEDDKPLPENRYLSTEDTLTQVSDLPDDEDQYVDIESVPNNQGIKDSNVKLYDAESILDEKYVNWEKVDESMENKARWLQPTSKSKLYRKQRQKSNAAFTPAVSKIISLDAPFREKQNAEDTLITITNRDANIGSHPNSTSPIKAKTEYVQYSGKPSDNFWFLKTNSNTEKELYGNLYSTTTELSKNVNFTNIENKEFDKMFDSINKGDISLSVTDVSAEEDKIYSDDEIYSSSEFSSSSENGLAIEFPRSVPNDKKKKIFINTKFNNTKTLENELFKIFADVVKEIAVPSNVTKQERPA